MSIPAILAGLKQQQANLQECITATSECFEIHKSNPKEIVRLARSIIASQEAMDRVGEQIRLIEVALGQTKRLIQDICSE